MRSLDKMMFMVFTGKRNPERAKSPTNTRVFISERRQEAYRAIKAKQALKLREKLLGPVDPGHTGGY